MHTRTRITLAAMIVACVSSIAMAQNSGRNDAPAVVSQDVVARAPLLTEVAWSNSPQSTHSRLRQNRNAGLQTGEYVPWSGPQASAPGYNSRVVPSNRDNDDNYQYWHQACCQ